MLVCYITTIFSKNSTPMVRIGGNGGGEGDVQDLQGAHLLCSTVAGPLSQVSQAPRP